MPDTAQAARVFVDGEVLAALMSERGWDADEVGHRADIAPSTVRNIVAGRTGGSRLVQKAIARAFKVPPTELEG